MSPGTKIGLFSRQKLKKFPLRGARFVTIPIILTALTNKYIFLLGCQKISTYIEINYFSEFVSGYDVFREVRVESHLRNYLRNSRPEITNFLRNSRPDPKNGVSYKKKTCTY